MTTLSPAKAAAWMQLKIDHDDRSFRRRSGASDALTRLRAASEALVYRISGDRVDVLLGRRLGGEALPESPGAAGVEDFVTGFYGAHWPVFSASVLPVGSLRVERVRPGSPKVVEVQQYVDGIPVADARWTLVFDGDGYLTRVMGAPFDPARITVARRPAVAAEDAVALALADETITREDVEATATLAIEGRSDRLLWTVELNGTGRPGLTRALDVDAHRRTVVARRDRRGHGTVAIPITHYSHPGGIKDSSELLTTIKLNVDSAETQSPKPGLPSFEFFSLQRVGPGRSRIWNGKPAGDDMPPVFVRTVSSERDHFTKLPGATTNNVFNEQQTYFWAQTLKSHVDEWGREPNAYGHYPVDAARAVNVEIVVNGEACMEDDWKESDNGVMHGFFRRPRPGSWFSGHPSSADTVPAVFLFNSKGNEDSPQFFGPEHSSSYSLVAHEVGHFISWQYGDWSGPSGTQIGDSLNEGHSMVLSALLGKAALRYALEYDESAYVTTGGKTNNKQWSHFVYGQPALQYSKLDGARTGDCVRPGVAVRAGHVAADEQQGPGGRSDLGQRGRGDREHRRPVHVRPSHVHRGQHDDLGQTVPGPARSPPRPDRGRQRAGPAPRHLLRRLRRLQPARAAHRVREHAVAARLDESLRRSAEPAAA